MVEMNLGELLVRSCVGRGDKIALEDPDQSLTYSQLHQLSARLAEDLRERGLVPDEPAIVFVSNRAMDWVCVLALWRAGGVLVPVHRSTPPAAFTELISRTGVRFLLDASKGFEPLGKTDPDRKETIHLLGRPAPAPRQILSSAAFIVFTSGSTGRPKGAVISHHSFARKLEALQTVMQFTPATKSLLVLQMTFSFGIWVSLLTLIQGGTLVMREKFDTLRILQGIKERQVTTAAVVPTMLRAVFGSQEAEVARALGQLVEHGTLRHFILGGETLDDLLAKRLRETFPAIELFDVYGTTETATSDFIVRPADHPALDGTIGRASPGVEYRVVGDDGRDVAPGGTGELLIHSIFAMNGYLDDPELTQQSFTEGYFRTGDLVRVREDGALRMVGRSKEIISRGANKVSPLEIEAALMSHPSVSEAIVTGVPDPLMGERIHGLVVPVQGACLTAQELRSWVGDRLDKFKVPDAIHFGTEIPRGKTGKADRAQLRRDLVDAPARPRNGRE